MKGLTRRIFVATSVAVFAFSRRSLHGFGTLPVDWDPARDLGQVFEEHRSSAEAVGREYLCSVPTEACESRLVALICAEQTEPLPIRGGPRAIREWARARIRDDFRAGRVVEMQGWIVSATEVRLCALSALSSTKHSAVNTPVHG